MATEVKNHPDTTYLHTAYILLNPIFILLSYVSISSLEHVRDAIANVSTGLAHGTRAFVVVESKGGNMMRTAASLSAEQGGRCHVQTKSRKRSVSTIYADAARHDSMLH